MLMRLFPADPPHKVGASRPWCMQTCTDEKFKGIRTVLVTAYKEYWIKLPALLCKQKNYLWNKRYVDWQTGVSPFPCMRWFPWAPRPVFSKRIKNSPCWFELLWSRTNYQEKREKLFLARLFLRHFTRLSGEQKYRMIRKSGLVFIFHKLVTRCWQHENKTNR